eukprot:SAG25_NODE_1496_length_2901_cov_7.528667_3_plen_97_part_00
MPLHAYVVRTGSVVFDPHHRAAADDGVDADCAILSVECPEGVGEGDALYVTTPDGVEIEVVVRYSAQQIWCLSGCCLPSNAWVKCWRDTSGWTNNR